MAEIKDKVVINFTTDETIKIPSLSLSEQMSLVDIGLASDYSYMPNPNYQDLARAVSADIQANAGTHALGKVIAGAVGGFSPLGGLGVGLGMLMYTAGADAYTWASNIGKNENEFWSDYRSNLEEIAREDSAFSNAMEGWSKGSSFVAGANVPVKKSVWNAIGEGFGFLQRDVAASLFGGVAGMVGANVVQDASDRFHKELGMGTELGASAKAMMMTGLASGVTSTIFLGAGMKMASRAASEFFDGAVRTGIHAFGTGAALSGYAGSYNALDAYLNEEESMVSAEMLGGMFVGGMLLSRFMNPLYKNTKGVKMDDVSVVDPTDAKLVKEIEIDEPVGKITERYLKNPPKPQTPRLYDVENTYIQQYMSMDDIGGFVKDLRIDLAKPTTDGLSIDQLIEYKMMNINPAYYNETNLENIRTVLQTRLPNASGIDYMIPSEKESLIRQSAQIGLYENNKVVEDYVNQMRRIALNNPARKQAVMDRMNVLSNSIRQSAPQMRGKPNLGKTTPMQRNMMKRRLESIGLAAMIENDAKNIGALAQ